MLLIYKIYLNSNFLINEIILYLPEYGLVLMNGVPDFYNSQEQSEHICRYNNEVRLGIAIQHYLEQKFNQTTTIEQIIQLLLTIFIVSF